MQQKPSSTAFERARPLMCKDCFLRFLSSEQNWNLKSRKLLSKQLISALWDWDAAYGLNYHQNKWPTFRSAFLKFAKVFSMGCSQLTQNVYGTLFYYGTDKEMLPFQLGNSWIMFGYDDSVAEQQQQSSDDGDKLGIRPWTTSSTLLSTWNHG